MEARAREEGGRHYLEVKLRKGPLAGEWLAVDAAPSPELLAVSIQASIESRTAEIAERQAKVDALQDVLDNLPAPTTGGAKEEGR